MKHFALTVLMTLLLTGGVFAQDDTTTYEEAFFSAEYPAEFIAIPGAFDAFMPFPNVAFAPDADIQSRSLTGTLQPDDWGVGLLFFPASFYAEMGLPADMTLVERATAMDENPAFSQEEITLADGTPAVLVDYRDDPEDALNEDNLVIFFEAAEGVYALTALLTPTDGRTDAYVESLTAVANSIEFTGTEADVLAEMESSMAATTFYEEEAFSLSYPSELRAYPNLFGEADESMVFPNIGFASSQNVVDQSLQELPFEEDGWGIAVIFLPRMIFAEMGVTEDAPLAEIAETYIVGELTAFIEDEAELNAMVEMLEFESLVILTGREYVQFDLPGENEDNLVVMFEPAEGVVALSALLTAPGARTQAQIDQWLGMVETIEFTGSVDDMLMGME